MQGVKTTSKRSGYDSAWQLGVSKKEKSVCKKTYSRCGIRNIVSIVRGEA